MPETWKAAALAVLILTGCRLGSDEPPRWVGWQRAKVPTTPATMKCIPGWELDFDTDKGPVKVVCPEQAYLDTWKNEMRRNPWRCEVMRDGIKSIEYRERGFERAGGMNKPGVMTCMHLFPNEPELR